MTELFGKMAQRITQFTGSPWAFLLGCLLVLIWMSLGPHFGWSDAHSLFINTTTTIVTFLLVFLIQFSQNKDTKALHIKLDALIKAHGNADNKFISIEKGTLKDIERALHDLAEDVEEEEAEEIEQIEGGLTSQ